MVFGWGKQTVNGFFENENFELILFSESQNFGEANASPVPRPLSIGIGIESFSLNECVHYFTFFKLQNIYQIILQINALSSISEMVWVLLDLCMKDKSLMHEFVDEIF